MEVSRFLIFVFLYHLEYKQSDMLFLKRVFIGKDQREFCAQKSKKITSF